jgi:2,3-bisphosphoglycerate-independent phosphoglycerate mutase
MQAPRPVAHPTPTQTEPSPSAQMRPPRHAAEAAGLNGLMDSVEPGLACGSDTSHMNVLGYDPRRWVLERRG